MKNLTFEEVARVINHSGITEIDLQPIKQEQGKWALYHGVNKVPPFTYEFYILYLLADLTKEAAYNAAKAIIVSSITQVVYAPSIRKENLDELRQHVKRNIAGIRDTKEYLISFIQNQLSKYNDKINRLSPAYFTEPHYETPSGFPKKTPPPLLTFFDDPTYGGAEGTLAVLLADPGQGKTYTTLYLASELSKQKKVPIYINSKQWSELREDDLTSIWKTIAHSFKYFESPVHWIEGAEEDFINVTMKAGLFRIIFDGFDEYILWNGGKIDANEALSNLLQLASVSGSRILVTSRTSFWESNISEESLKNSSLSPQMYRIIPFDHNQAENYFKLRFDNNKEPIKRAMSIYIQLKSAVSADNNINIAGRGFILNLIADLSSIESQYPKFNRGSSVIQWIMEALCQREIVRQKLPLNATQQLQIFRLFAEEFARGNKPSTQLLRDAIDMTVDTLTEIQINNLVGETRSKVGSLQDHPLIQKVSRKDEWTITHEQIFFNLLAEQVNNYVAAGMTEPLKGFFRQLTVKGSFLDDLANTIGDQILAIGNEKEAKLKTKALIASLVQCCSTSLKPAIDINRNELILATTVAFIILNRLCPIGRERTERTTEFLSYFGNIKLKDLHFKGTISNMDFSGTEFSNCKFDNLLWANCRFSDKTIFEECHFVGGKIIHCEDFGISSWIKPFFDANASIIIAAEKLKAGKKEYTEEDVRRDIEHMLKKFYVKEGVGFKSVHEDYLIRGLISTSIHKDAIIEILSKHIIEKHTISRVSGHAFNIRSEAKVTIQDYINNGVFTGRLSEAYREICKKLKISS